MKIIAHRGLSNEYLENTLPAFQAAIDQGFTYLECDVHPSRNAEPIIFHDPSLRRLAQKKAYVQQFSAEELATFTLYANRFRLSGTIPTLESLLAILKKEHTLFLELKTDHLMQPYPLLCKAVDELLMRANCEATIIVQSFEESYMRYAFQYPVTKHLLTTSLGEASPLDELKAEQGIEAVNIFFGLLKAKDAQLIRSLGLQIHAFTVNKREDYRLMREMGVDGMFTDHANQMREWLSQETDGAK